jgi:hypothetical protein
MQSITLKKGFLRVLESLAFKKNQTLANSIHFYIFMVKNFTIFLTITAFFVGAAHCQPAVQIHRFDL